jgi:hypothetical protein
MKKLFSMLAMVVVMFTFTFCTPGKKIVPTDNINDSIKIDSIQSDTLKVDTINVVIDTTVQS